jgi:mono/diheme cytochrome c family protein
VLAHEDRPQLPTNVVRLTFERQAQAFARIAPGGGSLKVSEGYRIARQNCIRCHAAGETGGTKSAKSWKELAQDARSRPEWFARVIKDPKSVSPGAAMPGNPEYDAATLETLTAYFRSQLQTEGQ